MRTRWSAGSASPIPKTTRRKPRSFCLSTPEKWGRRSVTPCPLIWLRFRGKYFDRDGGHKKGTGRTTKSFFHRTARRFGAQHPGRFAAVADHKKRWSAPRTDRLKSVTQERTYAPA